MNEILLDQFSSVLAHVTMSYRKKRKNTEKIKSHTIHSSDTLLYQRHVLHLPSLIHTCTETQRPIIAGTYLVRQTCTHCLTLRHRHCHCRVMISHYGTWRKTTKQSVLIAKPSISFHSIQHKEKGGNLESLNHLGHLRS